MPALIKATDGTVWDAETQKNPDVKGNESRNSFLWNCYHHQLGIFFQVQIKNAILRAINAVHGRNTYSFDGDFLALQNALYESIKTRINEDPERKQPFMLKIADIVVCYAQNENDISKLQKNKLFKTSVEFAHRGIKRYDSEAFLYEDVRLQKISNLLTSAIPVFFNNDPILQKVVDIIVFLMKEDIYYRPRFIQIIQDITPTVDELNEKTFNIHSFLVVIGILCKQCVDFQLTHEEIANIERWH